VACNLARAAIAFLSMWWMVGWMPYLLAPTSPAMYGIQSLLLFVEFYFSILNKLASLIRMYCPCPHTAMQIYNNSHWSSRQESCVLLPSHFSSYSCNRWLLPHTVKLVTTHKSPHIDTCKDFISSLFAENAYSYIYAILINSFSSKKMINFFMQRSHQLLRLRLDDK